MENPSFDNHDGQIWLDGKLVPWREANIHVLSHGLHYASAVFEGARSYNGKIFKVAEHSQRLHNSAAMMDFKIPFSAEQIAEACYETLKANKIVDGYIRPIAWRGSEKMGISAEDASIHLSIATWLWPNYFSQKKQTKGIALQVSKWRRPSPETEPVHAKASGLYMICTLSKHEAKRAGFDDALMYDWRGRVAESTAANVFIGFGDGKLHTPIPDCFLDGITRRTVIGLARDRDIEVIERPIMPDELDKAEEVFLAGTAVEITPVGRINDLTFSPGKISLDLMEAYEAEVHA